MRSLPMRITAHAARRSQSPRGVPTWLLRSTLAAAVCCLVACPVSADSLERIDGTTYLGATILGIADGQVTFTTSEGGEPLQVAVTDLREIEFQSELRVSPGRVNVRAWTIDGGVLEGTLADGEGDVLVIESRLFAPVSVPFETLTAFRWYPRADSGEIAGFQEELADRKEVEDVLYVKSKQTWVRILGLVEAVSTREVKISWEGTTRNVALEKVGGVVFAPGGQQSASASGAARVRISGGSEMIGTIAGYDGQHLSLELPGGVVVPIVAGALEEVTFLTDRILYLSDVEPAAFREESFFNRKWGYRRDACVLGGPLSLGRVTYEKGLGLHASASLEYALDGAYETFSAVLGIDDQASPPGSVTFRVLLDGKETLTHSARSGDSARPIRVPLAGATRLTLEVDYGADELDIGDLADWADAKLTR